MKHMTLSRFWRYYQQLSKEIQALADNTSHESNHTRHNR